MKKILIAEDDKFLANAYRVKLSKSSYEVKITSDGQEFLQVLATFQPDLVILDLVMPKVDGFTALQKLRTDPKWKSLPVVVASNLGQKEDIERAKKMGATDYVVKSDLSMKSLIAKVEKMIGKGS